MGRFGKVLAWVGALLAIPGSIATAPTFYAAPGTPEYYLFLNIHCHVFAVGVILWLAGLWMQVRGRK